MTQPAHAAVRLVASALGSSKLGWPRLVFRDIVRQWVGCRQRWVRTTRSWVTAPRPAAPLGNDCARTHSLKSVQHGAVACMAGLRVLIWTQGPAQPWHASIVSAVSREATTAEDAPMPRHDMSRLDSAHDETWRADETEPRATAAGSCRARLTQCSGSLFSAAGAPMQGAADDGPASEPSNPHRAAVLWHMRLLAGSLSRRCKRCVTTAS